MSRFVLSLLVIVPAVALAPRVALAGLEACGNECLAGATRSVSCTASPEPPRMPPIVPGVIVLAAIGAVAVRMNRRGGP
jgi:hypothetical protein